jgi:Zn-finger nucleic acid-binding protein
MVGVQASHCSRCGAAIQRSPAAATALVCPGCRAKLVSTTVGPVALDQCPACGGVWVGLGNFQRLAADRAERGLVLGALPGSAPARAAPAEPVRYRPCPQCGQLMNRANYARISGVILDLCKDHGLWFDRDELRQVLAFIEGGGLEKGRQRQVAEDEERLRRAAEPAPSTGTPWGEEAADRIGEGLFGKLFNLFF